MWILSRLYGSLQGIDRFRFDTKLSKPKKSSIPVISVGNLTVGGTGKTVFVDFLLNKFSALGSLGVACRGYRSGSDGWNDEMKLLKKHHPEIPIEADPDRWKAVNRLAGQGCQLAILDDGFQHRRLERDVDIVLLDATEPFGKDQLPRGRRREDPSALHRADLIVLSHAGQIKKNKLEKLRKYFQLNYGCPVLSGQHKIKKPYCYQTKETLKPGSVHLLAGVARPDHVKRSLENLGYSIAATTFPGDHRSPNKKALNDLSQSQWPIVCTEKDWIKNTSMPWYVVKVKWEPMEISLTLDKLVKKYLDSKNTC